MNDKDWKIIYDHWKPSHELLREALCTLGNGYFATRGAAEESKDDNVHYPGTYLACGYSRRESRVAGKLIENEDLVNWPNWLCLTFRIEGEEWFDLRNVDLLEYTQTLNMRHGTLERRMKFRDKKDRETALKSRRFVHMDSEHLSVIIWEIQPLNWSGLVEFQSALDGTVINNGVERYRALEQQHLQVLQSGDFDEAGIFLLVQTGQSRLQMAQAARTQIFCDGKPLAYERKIKEKSGRIAMHLSVKVEENHPIQVEKLVTLFTSRDRAISEPLLEAKNLARNSRRVEELLPAHKRAWSRIWRRCDIQLDGGEGVQHLLRMHIFHLLQTVSMNTIGLDVGIPSRGWHGEAYRGHIFWDELFIFPFLNLRIPELTRSLLMYRYRRLPEARLAAQKAGFKGAMYPWQSGSNGREESQVIHLNPRSGEWEPDNTHLQRHINAAIVYNIWQYYQATGDHEFMSFYGAEMVLDIARFWSSIAILNPERCRYEIRNIVGPDEYHTQYPDADQLGINNNAYTNIMAVWVLRCADRVLQLITQDRREELLSSLGIDDKELARWQDISHRMYVPFHDGQIISQFEGYDKLKDFDWEGYRKKYDDIQRLDRILAAEQDTPNHYKASKQADVLMLFYLFSAEELTQLFERLEIDFKPASIPLNIDYYQQRTSDGSTLSRIGAAWVMARSDRERSWHYFQEALHSDFKDIQGGTTPEGIHLGAMAGTVDIVQRCYTGLEIRDDILWFNPTLPDQLRCVKLQIIYRGHQIALEFKDHTMIISLEQGVRDKVRIGFNEKIFTLKTGEIREFHPI
ncbi:glycoside hydrolase family 65 protein [candidate division KSB1 bacterium]|nr:glycoside hydrolase family 65 protein [candidate division KSB1 bacterium]